MRYVAHTADPLCRSERGSPRRPGEPAGPACSAEPVGLAEPEVMTAEEVAVFLRVNRKTVFEYAARGVLPHQRLGKRLLFSRTGLLRWLSCRCSSTDGEDP